MDEDFGEELRAAVGEFVRRARAAAADSVSASVVETLSVLAREGRLSVADLARRRGVRHQSQSSTIAEVRELGLVDRIPDPQDGRGWLVELTSAGHHMIAQSRAERARWIARSSAGLDEDELRVLERIPAILRKMSSTADPRP